MQFVISCDTSYSGDVTYVGAGEIENKGRSQHNWNGRGDHAVSEVIFKLDEQQELIETRVHGILADGKTDIDFDVCGDNIVGYNATETDFGPDQILVKSVLGKGSKGGEGGQAEVEDEPPEIEDSATWFVKGKISEKQYLGAYAQGWRIWNTILIKRT